MHDQGNHKSSLVSDRHFGYWLLTAAHQGFPQSVFEFSLRCELESIEWAPKLKTRTGNWKTLFHFDFVLPVVIDLESIYLESMSAKHLHVVRSYNISCKSWNLNLKVSKSENEIGNSCKRESESESESKTMSKLWLVNGHISKYRLCKIFDILYQQLFSILFLIYDLGSEIGLDLPVGMVLPLL